MWAWGWCRSKVQHRPSPPGTAQLPSDRRSDLGRLRKEEGEKKGRKEERVGREVGNRERRKRKKEERAGMGRTKRNKK